MGAMPLMLAALAFSPQAVRERPAGAGLVSHPSPCAGRVRTAPAALVYAPAMPLQSAVELPLSRLLGLSIERLRLWWDSLSPAALGTFAVVSAAAIGGDFLSQVYEGSWAAAGWNAERTLRFLFVRICCNAPAYSMWLRCLERLTHRTPRALRIPVKLGLDCFVWTPLWHLLFFTTITVMSGSVGIEQALRQTLQKMATSLPASWSFWLPVQLVTFSVCPMQYRLMFVSVISFVWNAILSTLAAA